MEKILFDTSIHLGQFSITDEAVRIACKNSQAMISVKPDTNVIGIESFNENSFADNIIWKLPRLPQDVFYKFMDLYHSIKSITRIPLTMEDTRNALEVAGEFSIDLSNALTCALAIKNEATEVHSYYQDFKKEELRMYLETHQIKVIVPQTSNEMKFKETDLEAYYQETLDTFRKFNIHITEMFHR